MKIGTLGPGGRHFLKPQIAADLGPEHSSWPTGSKGVPQGEAGYTDVQRHRMVWARRATCCRLVVNWDSLEFEGCIKRD